jgi:hypothetical protein
MQCFTCCISLTCSALPCVRLHLNVRLGLQYCMYTKEQSLHSDKKKNGLCKHRRGKTAGMYTVRSYVCWLYERGMPTKTECCCTHNSAAREEGGENWLNCEYVTFSRQTSSTRIAKHRPFIKLKFLLCSSCKTLADQVARNPRFYYTSIKLNCICWSSTHCINLLNFTCAIRIYYI